MYLKSLEIHGFKSFADKTVIQFHQGVTGIVGPNGCGKSNVVDAIRWVLGETSAKALRGGEMADVIFNGTERRKPMGMAEVILTLADCEALLKVDYNEISITRRVYRDGRSEYRINNTLCRLKDINDLFMDTGIGRTAYSIMAQGQIDQILSSKPEERRAVFEEAAGITKYKREKREALRKLEYTEVNLLRVSDVLAEQERRMGSLKRQVAKARRYQALSGNVRVLDTHLNHRKFTALSAERGELAVSLRSLEAQEAHLEQQMPGKEEAVAFSRSEARTLEVELAELRQRLNEHRNALNAAEARIAFNGENKQELETRIRQNREDIAITSEKLAQQEFAFVAANESLEILVRRIAEMEIQLEEQGERSRVAKGGRERIEAALRESRGEANRTQMIAASVQAKIESAMAQLESSRERAHQLAEEEERLTAETEEFRMEQSRFAAEVETAGARITELEEAFQASERSFQHGRGDLDAARAAADETHKLLALRSSRLDVVRQLVTSGEGFAKGTRAVLAGLDDPETFQAGVLGVLANYIEADNTCARALEAALGSHLQVVMVADDSFAESVIQRLTEHKLGRAAVLPESFTQPASGTQMITLPEGSVAWALDRVRTDKRVSHVVQRLLENVLIVPDLASALSMRGQLPGVSFATLAGELLLSEGIIQGGTDSGGSNSVLERQNEVRSLEAEVAGLQASDEQARAKVASLEAYLEQLREEVEIARERVQRQKVELSTLQGQLSLATREVENFETKLANVRWERGELAARELAAQESRSHLEEELAAARARMEALETDQRRLQSEADSAARNEAELAETLNELRTLVAVERRAKQAAEEQQRPMEARLHELRELAIRRETEIASFIQRIDTATAENLRLAEACETHRSEAEDLQAQLGERSSVRTQLAEAIEVAEYAVTELRRQIARVSEQKGREEVQITKLDLRLENLVQTTMERHQVDLTSFEPDAHALLACIASQKALQARGGRQVVVASDDAEDDMETVVVVATSGETSEEEDHPPVPLPGEMTGEPDWDFVEHIVGDLKRRLDSMGPVNVDAIEEYEELEERYTFLRNQHDDLVKSKAELLEVIERINTETQIRFAETFAQVRENFRIMFQELFGEQGKADLMLIDENDPLESGIEVIAKPPGKKLQSITLLSGGERSMTAVALLFSIYMIKPSPFCVLDELDAPLDESNIGRFIQVLDRFIDNSQFIIVTHSKRTMARADVMYGVTMEEFGVSKPVGMRLTAGDEHKKPEAKTAAQKAALRLDG